MSDYGFDGMTKVAFVATLANPSAPTAVALTAGTQLDPKLTPDGIAVGGETAEIDNSKLNSTGTSAILGRDSFSLTLKYVRGDDTAALAVQTALVRGASGYIVVRRDKLATVAWAAADKVEVYPVLLKRPVIETPAPNALQIVTVGTTITDSNLVRAIDNPATVA